MAAVVFRENPNLSDDGLNEVAATLKPLPVLRYLDLGCAQTTDVGLVQLRELKSLRTLNLRITRISDAGLPHLRVCPVSSKST